MTKTELHTPKTVAQIVGVDPELLKVWCNEFNVQTERTNGGHRRYSKENIEELKAIKEKVQEQNWSYDQVRSWRNGELDVFVPKEEKSELEKKLDKLLEQNEQLLDRSQRQEDFNRALVEQLATVTKRMEQMEIENRSLKESLEDRDVKLVESMRMALETKQQAALAEEEEKSKENRNKDSLWGKLAFWK